MSASTLALSAPEGHAHAGKPRLCSKDAINADGGCGSSNEPYCIQNPWDTESCQPGSEDYCLAFPNDASCHPHQLSVTAQDGKTKPARKVVNIAPKGRSRLCKKDEVDPDCTGVEQPYCIENPWDTTFCYPGSSAYCQAHPDDASCHQ